MIGISGNCLKQLGVIHCGITGNALITAVQGKLDNLEKLELEGLPELTNQDYVNILKNCGSRLTQIIISSRNVTGEGFVGLEEKFINLKHLEFKHCPGLTDQRFLEPLKMCSSGLQTLIVSGSEQLTCRGLHDIQGRFPNLQYLKISECAAD